MTATSHHSLISITAIIVYPARGRRETYSPQKVVTWNSSFGAAQQPLQRRHAELPALMTWDDHEVQNDYADRWSETFDDPNQFLLRRAAVYQAFYEHMPLRPSLSRPQGPAMQIYNRVRWGDLLEFSILDARQYRSREACYGPLKKGGGHLETRGSCPELFEPQRSGWNKRPGCSKA